MILIAAVAMFDSRASALPDPTGRFPGGLGPGFYPFWSAAMIAGAAVVVIYRWYFAAATGEGVFAKREAWTAPLKIAVPMPALIYLSFEKGFRVFLPKSLLYEQGFPL